MRPDARMTCEGDKDEAIASDIPTRGCGAKRGR